MFPRVMEVDVRDVLLGPAFTGAARPEKAVPVYETFVERLRGLGLNVACGVFGADMKVRLLNDGPVTIMLDSRA
mgnify:FL=1